MRSVKSRERIGRFANRSVCLSELDCDKWAVHREARRRGNQGYDIIELAIGEPDTPAPRRLIAAAIESIGKCHSCYALAQGKPNVIEAIAAEYAARGGRQVTRDNVIFMPGTQAALFAAMQMLAGAGEEVLVGDPSCATYEGVIKSAGADIVHVPLRPQLAFHMQAEDLETHVSPRARVLLLNTPHNPTGATLSSREISRIAEVCKRQDLWIICDEVYETMTYGASFASPFDTPGGFERTVVVSSISKSHMPPGLSRGLVRGAAALHRAHASPGGKYAVRKAALPAGNRRTRSAG